VPLDRKTSLGPKPPPDTLLQIEAAGLTISGFFVAWH
jgi:hypothetical protein